ncbi:Clathrin heavy chain 2 [Trichinella patagoniensis]|uniref:Clathrin heavy chain 2 n=1 Tax=Trichinella patagoniensis TaxID=990121 RepID=A0A0V0ZJ62_9BILA|nr:Clathrin heavy chain 2 [Trichinella patagoniensis]
MKPIPEPIKIQIFGKHKNLGIDASKIDCSTVSLQSDKYVCFREQTDRFTHIYVVYGEKYSAVCRLKNLTSCEFAVMNPSLQLIAILDDENLEVWDLQTETPKRYFDTTNHPIIFYKWIDINSILILTHQRMLISWNIENYEVKHIFQLKNSFSNCDISDILIDNRCEWFLIISPRIRNSMKLSSMMLLYNVHQQKTEVYSAVTACFLHFKPNANAKPCTLLCFVGRDSFYGWMIHIENLSKHGCSFVKKAISFSFSQRRRDDFPVAMQANDKYGILFVITSHGYLHVFDVNDSICLYEGMFTSFPVVLLTAYKDSGIVCVNEMGCIVTAVIDEEEIISCLSISLKNKSAVMKFARRCNLPGAEGLFSWEFWDLCNNGEYYRAAELAAIIHMDTLATARIIEYLHSVKLGKKEPNPVFLYFKRRLENGPLNIMESFKLCKLLLQRERKNFIRNLMKDDKAIKL